MGLTLEELYREAQVLPNESKAILVEKLVENIKDTIEVHVTRSHLDEVKKRRDSIRLGKVVLIDGEGR
jgi:hypothetical protein